MRNSLFHLIILLSSVSVWAESDLTFPQIAVGESFETILQIANDVASDDSVTFEVFSGDFEGHGNGEPFPVQFDDGEPTAVLTRQLSPFEEITVRISLTGSKLRNGWLRVRSAATGGKVSGSLIFRVRSGEMVFDSVGVTNAKRYRFAQIQFDDREPNVATGVAFVNPDDAPVEVTIDLFRGELFLERFHIELDANEHFAKLFSEIFPAFVHSNGTLLVETSASRTIPILTLRLDGSQMTSLPVRPLGFSLQYEIRDQTETLLESGFWVLDSEGRNLIGLGRRTGDSQSEEFGLIGSWVGSSFQCVQRTTSLNGSSGVLVFNGTSVGFEKTEGEPITGKVTEIGSDGDVISVNDFVAFAKY